VSEVTYHVMLPILQADGGELVGGEARECQSAGAAERVALAAVRGTVVGAIAFSRTGDPKLGEFQDARVIRTVGKVPADLHEICG
jgi:hypothetical protein